MTDQFSITDCVVSTMIPSLLIILKYKMISYLLAGDDEITKYIVEVLIFNGLVEIPPQFIDGT